MKPQKWRSIALTCRYYSEIKVHKKKELNILAHGIYINSEGKCTAVNCKVWQCPLFGEGQL